MDPIYFKSGENHLFGWLHLPNKGTTLGTGLIICNPFGYEAICAHRAIRALAEAAAVVGIPALRFDYSGTGDSTDIPGDMEQIRVWSDDVDAAVRELRRRTGVEQICLVGFRLGALIAVIAAQEFKLKPIGLVAIAPVVSGRRYVAELRTTRLASMLGSESQEVDLPIIAEAKFPSMEVSGFCISNTTLERLSQIDMLSLNEAPAQYVLVMDSALSSPGFKWAETVSSHNERCTYQVVPGLSQMLVTAPQFVVVPEELISVPCDWLLRRGSGVESVVLPPNLRSEERNQLSLNLLDRLGFDSTIIETPVSFGVETRLFGIASEPAREERRRRAVILLNAGADYHIGANRMHVPLARRWARHGYLVLRMDLAGLGDSSTRAGRLNEDVFPPAALDDIKQAIDMIQRRYKIFDVTVVGLCSGAYHALRCAVAGLPLSRVILINPQNYYWKEGTSLRDIQDAELVRNPRLYKSRLWSLQTWQKLLTGQVDIVYIGKIIAKRMHLAMGSWAREVARAFGVSLREDLGAELRSVVNRGVKVVFIFAQGEPGISLLRIHAGKSLDQLGARCRVHILGTGDHIFSKQVARAALENVLDEELFAPLRADEPEPTQTSLRQSA